MTPQFSNQRSIKLSRQRSARIATLLTIIALICATLVTAQAQVRRQSQKSAPGKFQVTPLYPTDTIVLSAAEKQSMLEKGIDPSMSINAPEQVAACSPEISIGPGTSPAGYLPLSTFGVPAIAGVTDDSVTNFNVPAYSYGGQSWTQIGISSNGYAVVGGGNNTSDNQFVNQLFPNPTRPNNVLAPFWTDLNPQAGGALRIALLTDGTNTWIVLDWEAVRYFSTTDTVNFQIWIGILGDPTPVEDITYPYGPISGMGNSNALTVGAENQLGDRGANYYFSFFGGGSTGTLPANGTELRVTTSTPASCQNLSAETAIGLTTDNRLVTFNTNAPGVILRSVPITGLINGEVVLAIDFRTNGQLYGFTNYNRIVTLNPVSGAATFVGIPNSLVGSEYGFDFNPTVDRIRIVNDQDQNARINPDTGLTAGTDTNLAYAPGDPFFGNDPTVTGAAYTNNFAGATSTTLYDIDAGLDVLVTQGSPNGSPTSPNSGQLFTVGSLGVDTNNLVGFDISGGSGIAYATLSNVVNVTSLYTINLANGNATLVGAIGSGPTSLRGLAISPIPPTTIFGLTTANQLVTFNSARPGLILSSVPITGLINGEVVLGIDVRPATSQLYGFTNYSRTVTIDPRSGAATAVGALAVGLSGSEYGYDFNPTVDRIRVVNDTDQNIRINPDTGALAGMDTNLNYAPGDPNFGQNPTVTGAAYTNNFNGATSTTLYDIDAGLDILTTQGSVNGSPTSPNTGQLFTIGPLGVNTSNLVGFDVAALTGAAYASLTSTVSGASSLYTINLATGAATLVGAIGSTPTAIRDIATSTIPPATVYGLTTGNRLVTFSELNPNLLLTNVPITGLINGEVVLGIDYRPATGQLYGFTGYNRLVTINPTTGAATVVAQLSIGLSGAEYGVDFNPTVDRLRIVNDTDQNASVDPTNGVVTLQTPLNPGNPTITGVAYTNNFVGATSTTLYDIDAGNDTLYIQNPPASGTLTAVGPLGVNTTMLVGFDISGATGAAYASLQPEGSTASSFYSINLSTGAATLIGTIGGAETIRDITLAPAGTIQFSASGSNVSEDAGSATVTVTRTGDTRGTATISYTTANGTAVAPGDYTATSGTLTFEPGETSKTINVPIINDTAVEGSETFTVLLSSPTGGAFAGTPNPTTITILDND